MILTAAPPADTLSATFAALADPTRRAILARLMQGETSVSELAQPFQMSLPAVTKHLRVLERAGLVRKGRDAQRRPCRIEAQPLKEATDWIAQYRQFWEQRLDRLDAYLQELQALEALQDPPTNASSATHAISTTDATSAAAASVAITPTPQRKKP